MGSITDPFRITLCIFSAEVWLRSAVLQTGFTLQISCRWSPFLLITSGKKGSLSQAIASTTQVLLWYGETCMFSLPKADFLKQTACTFAIRIYCRKPFSKEASMHHPNACNLKDNGSLLESSWYCSPSRVLHYVESNSAVKHAPSYSLFLCISGAFPVCCWPLFLLAFTPQTGLRPSPAKPESSPEREMGPCWRQPHLEQCSDSLCVVRRGNV